MARPKGSRSGRCQGCNHVERVRIERFLAADASIKGPRENSRSIIMPCVGARLPAIVAYPAEPKPVSFFKGSTNPGVAARTSLPAISQPFAKKSFVQPPASRTRMKTRCRIPRVHVSLPKGIGASRRRIR